MSVVDEEPEPVDDSLDNDEDFEHEFEEEVDDEVDYDEDFKQARSDLVRAALETQLMEYANKRTEQKRNLEELTCIIEEFMDSFIVLGYSYDGDPLTLVSASTQQQADSLSTLLQKFIVQSGQGKGPGGIL